MEQRAAARNFDRPAALGAASFVDLPVVDLHSVNVCNEILRAHHEWGLFHVVNHGVPTKLMESVVNACRNFFTSAQEYKDLFAADRGYRREGYNRTPALSTFGMQLNREHLYLYASPAGKRNSKKWPPSHENLVKELGERSMTVYEKIMLAMSLCLDLKEPLLSSSRGEIQQTFAAFSYPSCSPRDSGFGVPDHTDIGTLVLLFADTVPGLQVLRNDQWLTVQPMPGALTVSFGEIAEVLSNGVFRATQHRVLLNSIQRRFSCAVTFEPWQKSRIQPAGVDCDHPARYRSFVYQERYAECEQGKYLKHFAMLSSQDASSRSLEFG